MSHAFCSWTHEIGWPETRNWAVPKQQLCHRAPCYDFATGQSVCHCLLRMGTMVASRTRLLWSATIATVVVNVVHFSCVGINSVGRQGLVPIGTCLRSQPFVTAACWEGSVKWERFGVKVSRRIPQDVRRYATRLRSNRWHNDVLYRDRLKKSIT
ncbi:hypothetical protein H310_00495 [Aphanomyces invadans]|uniref:Uncharacterized protein n=1 Tax=Aphanomyces invadans TaxID=157072 RepID=A0A024UVY7_9STRA|nr:hypothetical protein H310_00495 [Aphanomyces invadans]ETW10120.1 hypothetical protein H310_00495 [Aphanomyces invadans]|eukprot:XP_008861531.1 hypothetical protein H310_00495 [Aphanomyces invadans]